MLVDSECQDAKMHHSVALSTIDADGDEHLDDGERIMLNRAPLSQFLPDDGVVDDASFLLSILDTHGMDDELQVSNAFSEGEGDIYRFVKKHTMTNATVSPGDDLPGESIEVHAGLQPDLKEHGRIMAHEKKKKKATYS